MYNEYVHEHEKLEKNIVYSTVLQANEHIPIPLKYFPFSIRSRRAREKIVFFFKAFQSPNQPTRFTCCWVLAVTITFSCRNFSLDGLEFYRGWAGRSSGCLTHTPWCMLREIYEAIFFLITKLRERAKYDFCAEMLAVSVGIEMSEMRMINRVDISASSWRNLTRSAITNKLQRQTVFLQK